MEVLYPRCAGLDVHKDTVVAGVRLVVQGAVRTEVRTFDTTTPGLLSLSAWLAEAGCTHVAMEATGVSWKPVWHVLSDGEATLTLANAAHVKNVPGRKTDVADALWLADLLAHGLIRPSFVPEAATQEMRALLRTRKQLVREQASHIQRLQKTLEDANLKLASVLSQVTGVSGCAIVQALIDGETDPDRLLGLVQPGVKAPAEKLRAALQGRVTVRHRFLPRLHLRRCRLRPDRRLPHAARRHALPGPRSAALQPDLARDAGQTARQADRAAGVHLHPGATPGAGGFCLGALR